MSVFSATTIDRLNKTRDHQTGARPMIDRRKFLNEVAFVATSSTLPLVRPEGLQAAREPTPDFNDQVAHILANVRRANGRFPGMVAAIVREGRPIGIAAEGVRKVGSPERVEVTDQFHLGSCTKAMTSTMIASLVDSGKLRWDSTLASVFPDEAGKMHADYRAVTLDQLLRHRAGLPSDVDWNGVPQALSPTLQRRSLLASALGGSPETAPGAAFGYSNLGYALAGLMAEEATATPWEDLLRRLVFEPMGMTSAGFGPPGSDRNVDQPWGHRSFGPIFSPTRLDNPPVIGPAGTVHASLVDWAKFASFHLGDGSANGRRILRPETLRKLHAVSPGEDYAHGWIVPNRNARPNGPTWEHGGSNTVWFAMIVLAPERRFGVLAATNAGGSFPQRACLEVVEALEKLEPTTRA